MGPDSHNDYQNRRQKAKLRTESMDAHHEYNRKMTSYPHIVSNPGIADGAPIIEGTRITVRTIAGYYQMGMDVDEILTTLSHLKTSQVHSALTYFFDHQQEIDRARDTESEISKTEKSQTSTSFKEEHYT